MANTVHGPFTPINVTNGSTPANATWGNNAQTQADAALNGFNGDLLSAFVLSGITCAKDGTVANQLDIASGRAYITLSDGTRGLIVVGADNTHTTVTANSTYHLYLQPDGTWYWNTANTPAANSLAICTVATDASGNISTVTDARVTSTTLLSGMVGDLAFNQGLIVPVIMGQPSTGAPSFGDIYIKAPQIAGGNHGVYLQSYTGTSFLTPLGVGDGTVGIAATTIGNTGIIRELAGQATAGSFGVPVIVAQALSTHVTTTTTQVVVTFTVAATGLYRASLYVYVGNATSPATITADVNWGDPNDTTHTQTAYFTVQNASTGATTPVTLKGASVATAVGANALACFPIVIYQQAGAAQQIDIRYTDGTGTPNDFVTAMIERLA